MVKTSWVYSRVSWMNEYFLLLQYTIGISIFSRNGSLILPCELTSWSEGNHAGYRGSVVWSVSQQQHKSHHPLATETYSWRYIILYYYTSVEVVVVSTACKNTHLQWYPVAGEIDVEEILPTFSCWVQRTSEFAKKELLTLCKNMFLHQSRLDIWI